MDWIGIAKLLKLDVIAKKGFMFWRRPRLALEYMPQKTPVVASDVSVGGRLAAFYHLLVKNDGKSIAKNCKGKLISVAPLPLEESVPTFRKPEILKWANEEDFSAKDVDYDPPRYLDLCFVYEGDQILHFFLEPTAVPTGTRKSFPPGEYQIKVRIECENCSRVDKVFNIKFSGTWDSLVITKAE